jgi:hypothetical protein
VTQRLTGKPATKEELLRILDDVRVLIEMEDSWEGLINWLMPEEDDPEGTYARVEARYRTGNSIGQGGFHIVGEWVDQEEHEVRHVDPGRGLSGGGGANADGVG